MADGKGYHEPTGQLSESTRDMHRALVSLQEELEAIDWYQQRIDASDDPELVRILAHNRDEEKEHAAMALEWLRRRDPVLDEKLRTYLFTEGDVTALEEAAEHGSTSAETAPPSSVERLTVGSLMGGSQ